MDKLFSDIDSLSQMSLEKAEKNLSEIRTYIENDFQGIARILESYHPLEILRRAAWTAYENEKKRKDEYTLAYYRLIPLLLQSILVSTHYKKENFNRNRIVKSKDYDRVLALSMDVHRRLLRYIDCKTVAELKKGTIVEADAERYRTNVFKLFYPPKENEERINNIYYVFDCYAQNENEKIEKVFKVKGSELSACFKAIADSSLTAIDKLSAEIKAFKSEVEFLSLKRREDSRYKAMSEEDMSKLIIRENKWESRSQTLAASRDDFDLFRPEFYSSLPESAYDAVAAEIGTLDLYSYLDNGLWPASMRPFIKIGAFTFTFLGSHMISYGNRMLMETIGTNDVPSRTAQYALSLLFTPTDVVDVYSFDGNKIDLFVLPTMLEVNPYIYPERFTRRLHDKNEEMQRKAKPGHNLLIVDPDTLRDELHSIGDHAYCSSASYMLKAIRSKAGIKSVHQTIFGTIEYPEGERDYDDSLLDSELDTSEPLEDELLDDYTSDEYEYAEDEELLEKKISEREAKLEEEPEDLKAKDRSGELARLKSIYELTPEIVKKEEEEEREREPLESELDEVEYQEEEDADDDFVDDSIPEDEELYDEVEKEDVYEKEALDSESAKDEDPSQLNFLALLDDDSPEEKELTNELIEDDEKEFEKEEEKAAELDKEYSDYVDADDYEDLEREDGEAPEPLMDSENRDKEFSDFVDDDDFGDLEKEDGVSSEAAPQSAEEPETIEAETDDNIRTDETSDKKSEDSSSEITEDASVKESEAEEAYAKEPDSDAAVELPNVNADASITDAEEAELTDDAKDDLLQSEEIKAEKLSDDAIDEQLETRADESSEEAMPESETVALGNDESIAADLEAEATSEINDASSEEASTDESLKDEPASEKSQSSSGAVSMAQWFALFNNDYSNPVLDDSDEDVKTIGAAVEEAEDPAEEIKDEDHAAENDISESAEQANASIAPENVIEESSEEELPLDVESAEAEEAADSANPDAENSSAEEEVSLDGESGKAAEEVVSENEPASEASAEEDAASEIEENTQDTPLSPEEERLLKEGIKKDSDGLYVMTGPTEYHSYGKLKDEVPASAEDTAEEDAGEVEAAVKEPEPISEERAKKLSPEDMIEEIEIPEIEESEEEKFLKRVSGSVAAIVKVLGSLDGRFVTFLKASDSDMLNYLNTIIESSWKRQQVDHKDKLFSIYDYSISVLLAETPVRDELRLSELLNNAGAVMYSKDADEWTALILYINEDFKVEDAMETTFTRDSFSQSDWKRIVNIGEILKSRSIR